MDIEAAVGNIAFNLFGEKAAESVVVRHAIRGILVAGGRVETVMARFEMA